MCNWFHTFLEYVGRWGCLAAVRLDSSVILVGVILGLGIRRLVYVLLVRVVLVGIILGLGTRRLVVVLLVLVRVVISCAGLFVPAFGVAVGGGIGVSGQVVG